MGLKCVSQNDAFLFAEWNVLAWISVIFSSSLFCHLKLEMSF